MKNLSAKYLSAKYLSANYLSAKNLSAKLDIYQPIEIFISQVGIFISQIPGMLASEDISQIFYLFTHAKCPPWWPSTS
jgi:hypothetical protein